MKDLQSKGIQNSVGSTAHGSGRGKIVGNGGSRSIRGAPPSGGQPRPEFFMDQAALDNPPAAPSNFMFIGQAIAHVGRAKIPDWNEAERVAMFDQFAEDSPSVVAIKSASGLLHQAIMDQKMTAYSRPSSGGGLRAMTADAWTNDYMSENIARSSGGPPAHGSVYLFVERAELEREFPPGGAAITTVEGFSLDQLSPYLRLMIEVSRQEAVDAGTRTKPGELASILISQAPRFGLTSGKGNDGSDITETWATQLAKALRWPDARKGRAEPGSTRKA